MTDGPEGAPAGDGQRNPSAATATELLGTRPLAGRRTLVAGASRGIGAAIARALAGAGARTTLLARSEDRLEALAAELDGRALPADLEDPGSVDEAVRALDGEGGVPELVVNAAGVFDLAPLDETSVATFDRNVSANLRAAFLLTRAVLPQMLDRGRGLIVHVGSVAGRKALPGNGAYSASKYGLRGVHEVLLEEIRGTGVRATLVDPAAVDTSLWDGLDPDERDDLPSRASMLRPGDVAEAVLFVATRPPHVQIPTLPIEAAAVR